MSERHLAILNIRSCVQSLTITPSPYLQTQIIAIGKDYYPLHPLTILWHIPQTTIYESYQKLSPMERARAILKRI